MASVPQQFAVRGSEGLFVYDDISQPPKRLMFQQRTNPIGHRLMQFSACGKFLAYCDGEKTVVLDTSDWQPRLTLPELPSTTNMCFSPKSTFFCAWHPFKGAVNKPKPATASKSDGNGSEEGAAPTAESPAPSAVGKANLKVFSMATMQLVAEFVEKNQKHWHPVWTDDEAVFARLVGSELLFHQDNDFSKYSTKLVAQKLSDFSISPSASPYHIAAYVPGGNQPANIRIYRYPEFQTAVANKTFFKADSVSMTWNKKGNALIVMALTEVDSTGKSYYGETNLYLVLANGDSFLLSLAKPGPVYFVDWHPNSNEFCVVYGYMPAKATLYNLKGEALFDFGTGPRNEVHYNPRGDIICICGFGNLRGNVEFWSATSKDAQAQKQKRDLKKVAHFTAEDTTLFRWSPDGRHFASATTAPRLRVNNGYKLWNAAGEVIFEYKTPAEQEMWEVAWRPVPISAFPETDVVAGSQSQGAADSKGAGPQKPQPAAYIPPHLRGQTNRPQAKLHDDYEPPSNVKDKQQNQDANLSKQALKNRKKREAAKTRQDKPADMTTQGASASSNKALEIVNSDAETQKKMKNVLKKLEQINVLKQKLDAGEKLEANQVEKIQKEEELRRELEELRMD